MTKRIGLVVCLAAVFTLAGLSRPVLSGPADDTPTKDGIEAEAAFKKLKTLVGSWTAKTSHGEKKEEAKKDHEDAMADEVSVTFKLTGAESALVETQFPGMPHEMVSVYHLDRKELRMTHYCAAHNQPHLKLDRAKSTPDEFVFVFDGGTNFDPEKDMHIHGLRIKFEKDGHVKSEWEGYTGGKKAGTTTFDMAQRSVPVELYRSKIILMAISFLHAADIHLDSPLKGLERYENAPVERMRRATRRAFERLIDLAIEKRVDFVLIAGDLYDGDCRDYNTGLYLTKQLLRLREEKIPVFIIAGNHDAANKMTRVLPLPENVQILSHDRPETVLVHDKNVAIHGQSFPRAAVTENLAAAYPPAKSGCINIGLLHTGLGGMKGHERYAPCTLDELRFKRYDYWALGHIHTREVMCEDPMIVFAGNVQGRHARETGAKGCLVSTIHSDHHVDHVFHRLDQVRWERGQVDLSGLDADADADAFCRTGDVLDELLASETAHDSLLAVRVILRGQTALHGRLFSDPDRLTAEVRNVATERGGDRIWIEKVELQLEPPRDRAMIEGPIDELLEVAEQLRHDRGSLDSVLLELGELKHRLPSELIHDPEGTRLSDADWLQSLLGHVQPLLVDLLAKSQAGSSNGGG